MRAEQGKPVLLVDVDGVISTWGWNAHEMPPGAWTLVDGVPHHLSRRAGDALLSVEAAFACVWCTGWEEKADEYLPRALGFGHWPHLSFDRRLSGAASYGHWKLAAIDAHVGPDRPLAWIDDAFDAACSAWAAARPGPTLLLATDPAVGLTPEHAAELLRWAAGL